MNAKTVLAIDTSTRYGGVGLWREGRMAAAYNWWSAHNHTAELMPAVEHVLSRAGIRTEELSVIAVALGPGGFSALRVGISVAKGLVMGGEAALIGVSTLETEAYPYADTDLVVSPLLEAGRGEVATALFRRMDGTWQKIEDEHTCTLEEMVETVPEGTLICGEGAVVHLSFLQERLESRAKVVEFHSLGARLEALAALAAVRVGEGDENNPDTLQPLYLRRPSVGAPKVHRKVKL